MWLLENILGTPPSPPPDDVEPLDPIALLASACALVAVGSAAGWLPAVRASRIDPMRALRLQVVVHQPGRAGRGEKGRPVELAGCAGGRALEAASPAIT